MHLECILEDYGAFLENNVAASIFDIAARYKMHGFTG